MLKIEYFNVRMLLGVLRSKKYPADGSNILYILEMCGVASNCLQEGGGNCLTPGAVMLQVTPYYT